MRRHLAIVGPTAPGKSALALALARRDRSVEVVSADAMQVYRGMDIGTAKPSAAERAEVAHHLLDVADPDEEFSLARYQAAARSVLAAIEGRGHRAVLVGGTGLYVQAVTDDLDLPGRYPEARADIEAVLDTTALHRRLATLDPVAATRMEPTNRRRVVRALEVTVGSGRPFSSFGPGLGAYPPSPFTQIGLRLPSPVLDERIARRFSAMLDAGLLAEVQALVDRRSSLSATAGQALGYRELLAHVAGRCSLDEAVAEALRRTRRFARRQVRWFRRDPRITWQDVGADAEHAPAHNSLASVLDVLESFASCS
ncbi:MAG TPA: tRNA (adenosine(37)-N6)-dimethylallyltransferase MiaA [Acidimicrobiales bacterium]|nr:tRNA (adenosine(37)-N6)-dimethylallyltransferase MiaA [Acidimicrobiales bacterium]